MTFQVVFAKTSCQLCSIYETIKEQLARGNVTAVYEDNLCVPVFVIVFPACTCKALLDVGVHL